MATYTVAAGNVGSPVFTTTGGSTVDVVTFTDDLPQVEMVNGGTADAWYTLDGTDPAVNGGASYYLPASSSDVRGVRTSGGTVVKITSASATQIRAQRGD